MFITVQNMTATFLKFLAIGALLGTFSPVLTIQAAGKNESTRAVAEQGNVTAQIKMGRMYYDGKGVKQDYKEAMHWFRMAAKQGNAEAQNSVGTLYDNGNGVPRDYKEAANWFRLAANQGHVLARRNLGWMYEKGQGFEKNYIISYMWHYLAAMARIKQKGSQDNKIIPCPTCDTVASKLTPDQIAQAQELARNWRPSKP
ncbi:MAG: hypothetical protein HW380_3663 [Magnetococcales bacterium]|nr:hypothetical protein [Magnetococcales bacterium]HIJ84495.1 sel1 repeat family protein [Magnetococcales bacterium]